MKKIITLLAFTALSIGSTLAAESKKDEGAPPNTDFFRCVRMKTSSIADLKARLVTECNLSKPFSFSGSESLTAETTYTFCCHKE